MNIELLGQRLAANGCGKVGESIFSNEMPTTCNHGILLLASYGTPVNNEAPGYYDTEFRLVSRSGTYQDSKALIEKAAAVLRTIRGYTQGTMVVQRCLQLNLPRAYRRSAGAYVEFEVELDINFCDSTLV